MPNDDELMLVHGPKDESGIQHFFLYCRRCHRVSDLIGSLNPLKFLTGKMKCIGTYDPREVQQKAPEYFGIFAPKIQQAMRVDGAID
ncbi:MAG: hypothetical protein WD423_03710 [Rhodothermales bacterium]